MAEKVAKVGVKREEGYLYFVDKSGDISRAKMARGGTKKKKVVKKKAEKKPAEIDTKKIRGFLENIKAGKGSSYRNVVIFPLFVEKAKAFDYVTLDEAMEKKWVEITEVSESGTVPELTVKNKSHKNVIIIDGEELVGAKQNRIINITIIIIAHSKSTIPVTCTEAGRWSYRGRRFASSIHTYAALRKAKTEQVMKSMEAKGVYEADQSAVWEEIDRKMLKMKSTSPTGEMRQIYIDREKELENYEKSFPPVKDANGVVVAIDGKIVCADIFDQPRTMSKHWKKLVNSYSMDAIEKVQKRTRKPTTKNIEFFLKKARSGNIKTHKSIGIGQNISIRRKDLIASGLACNNKVVHLSIFSK